MSDVLPMVKGGGEKQTSVTENIRLNVIEQKIMAKVKKFAGAIVLLEM